MQISLNILSLDERFLSLTTSCQKIDEVLGFIDRWAELGAYRRYGLFQTPARAARPSRLRFYDASTLPWRDYSILVFVIFDYRDLGLVVARVVIASLYLSS